MQAIEVGVGEGLPVALQEVGQVVLTVVVLEVLRVVVLEVVLQGGALEVLRVVQEGHFLVEGAVLRVAHPSVVVAVEVHQGSPWEEVVAFHQKVEVEAYLRP